MVDGVVFGIDELGDGHHRQTVLDETFRHIRQGGRCVERGVVEQHDAAGLHFVGDALADGGGIVFFPVQTVDVPLYRLHAHGSDGGDHVVIVLAVGAADQRGCHAGDGSDLLVAGGDVGNDLVGGEGIIVVVMIGMVHHLVARVVEGFDRLRVLIHPVAHHKKGGLDVIFGQNINELLGILIAPR